MTGTSDDPILTAENLRVTFADRDRTTVAVDGISFSVRRGETLSIVGESGSGKSVTALALLRLVELGGGRIETGTILFKETPDTPPLDLVRADRQTLRDLRGRAVSMVFQEPMSSLNPAHTVGDQIAEVVRKHEGVDKAEARRRAVALLQRVHLPDADRRIKSYPHELSGGMQQRVMIAMALACKPALLIADEPTTALDVTIQAGILDLIRDLKAETGMSVLFITHDMGVVAELADRVVVMRHGRIVEENDVAALFRAPQHPYTRQLLAAATMSGARRLPAAVSTAGVVEAGGTKAPLLEVRDLVTQYPVKTAGFKRAKTHFRAVDGVSLDIHPGEILAIVGESGSGKSTLGKSILRLVEPASGEIRLAGTDILGLKRPDLRRLRRHMQMVFQDPFGSLNPRRTAFSQIAEPLVIHGIAKGADLANRVEGLAKRVGIPSDMLSRYPHAFSGGQRQRLCIARALALSPKLIVADEAVSALDASIRAQVLELMLELQREMGLTYLFISHDIGVVRQISDRIGVMYRGKLVELGETEAVCSAPADAYTRKLLEAVPVADPAASRRMRRAAPGAVGLPA
ncbi:peptide/nickel transport system ATP-binding protein/glutathione transport system ATP-binding protein [Rhodobium orientis]|uniref:Glutathione import ATP-binding protein GsiA n=1 Tax=Rhodobium orientis TaxID=34017 RepID=A0A327JWI7_9HYPH|nr:ABC transporter ATP-binding protein [Rhodobium orientis]MBB4302800.1 peptide/nickel transport system ATP-binding protein/glutathione transport system ATP-binding protein [Rhodobium orientis]MBK5948580.1 ABC transporter ATP-binding protein [Rhodobium orientis]RAI29843.1 ABC transporter ATP-binding protein [Rhodobium orientis]